MKRSRKALVWGLLLVVGIALLALGVFYGVTRLDDADKWGSIIGAMMAVLGLPMTAYGIVLARRARNGDTGGQSVADSVVAGGVTQVRTAHGNVRIGTGPSPATAGTPGSPPPQAPPPSSGQVGSEGQSVTGIWTAGPVRQVEGIGGDVDVDG